MTIDAKMVPVPVQEPKWELAQRLAGHANAPNEALESIFNGAMEALEKEQNTTFPSSLKLRVWENVSKERLNILKKTFLEEFCKTILDGFSEQEIQQMLEEHKLTNTIKFSRLSVQLQVAHQLSQNWIIDVVVRKAKSMTNDWIPEIVASVEKEGIVISMRSVD